MRTNYDTYGVDGYYQRVSATYKNPHFHGVQEGCAMGLTAWFQAQPEPRPVHLRCLDLACGSGEASIAIVEWIKTGKALCPPSKTSSALSAAALHRLQTRHCALPLDFSVCLDASDPYTQEAYFNRTGRQAKSFSFQDVAQGCLLEDDCSKSYDLCVCSFAAHLIPESMLYATLSQLALSCAYFLILSPHKRPHVTEAMGWTLVHESIADMRVHVRLYRSIL
jgi:hypothetical protein